MVGDHFSFTIVEAIKNIEKKLGLKSEIKWLNFCLINAFHIIGFYWSFHYAFPVKWQTVLYAWMVFILSGMGITCGVHRLFTHRCYKVTQPLKIFLVLCFASAGQVSMCVTCPAYLALSPGIFSMIGTGTLNSIYSWVRDHRQHHKYSDTEADPHNANRGLLFSHIGWLMMKKNDLVLEKGKQMDMSDIESDPLLMWEKRHTTKLSLIFCYFLPTITCILLCGETWKCAVAWQCFIRVLAVLHVEMTVNSLAHAFGSRPYNKNIIPRQNIIVSTLTLGEGNHNYHHVFPYDYKAAETFDILNWTTFFIRQYKKFGLAYDLKEPSEETVRAVTERLRNNTNGKTQ